MTKLNYKKLLNSKWTAVKPENKEKHFFAIKVFKHPDDDQLVEWVTLEAVLTKRQLKLKPLALKDQDAWLEGWK
jgi:tryptophan-rich hypothetical protein